MNFETLNKSHLKRNMIIVLVVVGIIGAIVLNFTRAKYRTTESIPLVTGTINYSPYDIKVSTKLLIKESEYIELDDIPTNKGLSLINSSCTNGAVISWNEKEKGYEILSLSRKGTKCEAIYGLMDKEDVFEFDYMGTIQEFIVPDDGIYLLETWGAQGGSASNGGNRTGGYGGYSKGIIDLKKNDKLYIGVGGKGIDGTGNVVISGGYNGGGNGLYHGGSGGGATHIATIPGLLSDLEEQQEEVLIVSGGGGGAAYTNERNCSDGGHGGGIKGNDSTVNACEDTIAPGLNGYGTGGNQTDGGTQSSNFSSTIGSGGTGAFGKGATSSMTTATYGAGGGGGGFYGGGSSTIAGAGGGSGYIGNENLSQKAMYCYNCDVSFAKDTFTVTTESVSEVAKSNNVKEGNGYAKITLLKERAYQPQFDLEAKAEGQNITITIVPSEENLFSVSKYYYSINNNEYIESDSNIYTFGNLEDGEYVIKAYMVDSKGIISEVKTKKVEVIKGVTMQEILATYNKDVRNDFSKPYTLETTRQVYTATDWVGTSYYFAGNPTDNWVKFAGFYWRIIRINGDGSIRMIYQGTSANTTGWGTVLDGNYSETFSDEKNNRKNEHVGLKYTDGEQHGQSKDSTMMNTLNKWYNNNLIQVSDYIDDDIGFCGDRNSASGYSWSSQPSKEFKYAAYERLHTNKNPDLKCNNNDILRIPVGLITADEAMFGGLTSEETDKNYLSIGL